MGKGDDVAFHKQAIEIRNQLKEVFNSFGEISMAAALEKFSNFLKEKGKPLEFITLYEYINKTTPPAWLLPEISEFLTQEPYIRSQNVWNFIQKWAPFESALAKVRTKALQEKSALMSRAEAYDTYLT